MSFLTAKKYFTNKLMQIDRKLQSIPVDGGRARTLSSKPNRSPPPPPKRDLTTLPTSKQNPPSTPMTNLGISVQDIKQLQSHCGIVRSSARLAKKNLDKDDGQNRKLYLRDIARLYQIMHDIQHDDPHYRQALDRLSTEVEHCKAYFSKGSLNSEPWYTMDLMMSLAKKCSVTGRRCECPLRGIAAEVVAEASSMSAPPQIQPPALLERGKGTPSLADVKNLRSHCDITRAVIRRAKVLLSDPHESERRKYLARINSLYQMMHDIHKNARPSLHNVQLEALSVETKSARLTFGKLNYNSEP